VVLVGDGYEVDPAALERDALVFDEWSKVLDSARQAIPLDLNPLDFSQIPGAQEVFEAYQTAAMALSDYIDDGSTTFDGFARTLLKTVERYMEDENYSVEDINRVTMEMEAL
jgi:hypothetical protein